MTTLKQPPVSLLDPYQGEVFLPLYSTRVTVTGGEARHGRTSGRAVSDDGGLELDFRLPRQLGGPGGGTNPEQLLAASYGACFHGALTLVASRRRVVLPGDVAITVEVAFGRDPADGLFALQLAVEVALPGLDDSVADALIAETAAICPYSKMTRAGLAATITRIG